MISVEHGVDVRPFILGKFIAVRGPQLCPVSSLKPYLKGPRAVTEHTKQITLLEFLIVAIHNGGQFAPFAPFIGARRYPNSNT
ncbi:hypothetical protein D3C85_1328870 [compost metagenome]